MARQATATARSGSRIRGRLRSLICRRNAARPQDARSRRAAFRPHPREACRPRRVPPYDNGTPARTMAVLSVDLEPIEIHVNSCGRDLLRQLESPRTAFIVLRVGDSLVITEYLN